MQDDGSGDRSSFGNLLRRLGVPVDSFRNVILTNDIVPRAFACDYSRLNVAKVLRQLTPFSTHGGLQCDERSIMYNFVGRVVVLQPSTQLSWVRTAAEANHPLLPPGPGLYELCEPSVKNNTGLTLESIDSMDSYLQDSHDAPDDVVLLEGFMPASRPSRRPVTATPDGGGAIAGYLSMPEHNTTHKRVAYFQSVLGDAGSHAACRLAHLHDSTKPKVVHHTADLSLLDFVSQEHNHDETVRESAPQHTTSLHNATLALFDTPHPLVVLSNQTAYGDDGLISRFHHPDHYTQAVGSVMRSNLAPMRMLSRSMDPERVVAAMKAGLKKSGRGARHRFSWGLDAMASARKVLKLSPDTNLFGMASNLLRYRKSHAAQAAAGASDRC